VKWILTTIFSILTWIHISSWPHFTRITPTRLCTTWTNHIGRIGIIQLNMTHNPNLMIIIFKIISTLHRVNGDLPPLSQIFNHLIHNFHNIHSLILIHILLFPIPPTEEKSNLERSMEVMLESQQQFKICSIHNPSQIKLHILLFYNIKLKKNLSRKAFGSLLWNGAINSKYVGLIISTKILKVMLIFCRCTNSKWITISPGLKYGALEWVWATNPISDRLTIVPQFSKSTSIPF